MRKVEASHSSEKQKILEDLDEARERLNAERAAQRLAAERVEQTTREVELLKADLAATKQNLDKAEGDKNRVSQQPAAVPCRCTSTVLEMLCTLSGYWCSLSLSVHYVLSYCTVVYAGSRGGGVCSSGRCRVEDAGGGGGSISSHEGCR